MALRIFCSLGIRFVFLLLMLLAYGDIEPNPGPRKRSTCCNFSIYNWNLNSITAHNFEKVDLLEAYNTFKKIDIIYLSELCLDSSILSDNDNLIIKGYKLVRDDHPDDVNRDGICAYIRESLPVSCLFNTYFKECLILKVCINNKRVCII